MFHLHLHPPIKLCHRFLHLCHLADEEKKVKGIWSSGWWTGKRCWKFLWWSSCRSAIIRPWDQEGSHAALWIYPRWLAWPRYPWSPWVVYEHLVAWFWRCWPKETDGHFFFLQFDPPTIISAIHFQSQQEAVTWFLAPLPLQLESFRWFQLPVTPKISSQQHASYGAKTLLHTWRYGPPVPSSYHY